MHESIHPAVAASPDGRFTRHVHGHHRTAAILSSASRPIQRDDTLAVAIEDLVGPGATTAVSVRLDARGEASLPYLKRRVKLAGLSEPEAERAIRDVYEMPPWYSGVTVRRVAPPAPRPNWALLLGSGAVPAAILAALPLVLWDRHRRRAWLKQGRCPTCGYDTRASTVWCPECGTTPKASVMT